MRTELVFIIDKSGSMGGLERDTIGGFNSMLNKQKGLEGECRITTALFNNDYQLLHDRIDMAAVSPLTEEDYQVGGSTALIDAIGITLDKIHNAQKNTAESHRAEKVIFVIITDGEENASREYTSDKIKARIEEKKDKEGWEFIFLGANIDTFTTASNLGINPNRSISYVADQEGIALNYEVMGEVMTSLRQNAPMPEAQLNRIRNRKRK